MQDRKIGATFEDMLALWNKTGTNLYKIELWSETAIEWMKQANKEISRLKAELKNATLWSETAIEWMVQANKEISRLKAELKNATAT